MTIIMRGWLSSLEASLSQCEKGQFRAEQKLSFWYQIVAHIIENTMEFESN